MIDAHIAEDRWNWHSEVGLWAVRTVQVQEIKKQKMNIQLNAFDV